MSGAGPAGAAGGLAGVCGIDHTAVAVADLDRAIGFYTSTLGLTLTDREQLVQQGVEAALLAPAGLTPALAAPLLELVAPAGDTGSVARFLERRGPGLHHLAYRVDDIDAALATLRLAGVRLIDEQPHRGIGGSRVAFLHPSACGGVLCELVERPAHAPQAAATASQAPRAHS